jgi:GTPase SAR1 family protein
LTENIDNLPGIARRRAREAIKKRLESKNPAKSEYLLKVVIIGNSYKLIDRFVRNYADDKFDKNGPASVISPQICTKKVIVKNIPTKLILVYHTYKPFDSRQERATYRGASAGLIVFNKSYRKSFEKVTYWVENFRKHIPPTLTKTTWVKGYKKKTDTSITPPIALLGINTDSEEVSKDEGKATADLLDLPYFETSTPTFENTKKIFVYLCEKVIK